MIRVGIDVSKGKSTVCVMKPGGEILKPPFEILHTMEGVLSLVRLIETYDEEVKVVLEDTGYYHWPIVTCFLKIKIHILPYVLFLLRKLVQYFHQLLHHLLLVYNLLFS